MNKDHKTSEVFAFVPSYNHAPFIEKCLTSIINQTLPPRKLLVIDDGSRDDSPRIIERVLKDCPFDAELIVRENRGLCATLNQGFGLSEGKYFAYIGSAFIATEEANAVEGYKEMITSSSAEDIVYSNLFTGVHGNYLKPSIVKAGLDPDDLPTSDPSKMSFGTDASGERSKPKAWKEIWGSGQGIGGIGKVVPAAELIARFKKEYDEAVDPAL